MSSYNFRRRRDLRSDYYRLNRTSLMRMGHGYRKVSSVGEEYRTNVPLCVQLDDQRSCTIDQNGRSKYEDYALATSINESCWIDKSDIIDQNKSKTKTRRQRNNERRSAIIVRDSVHRRERSKPKMFYDQLLPLNSHRRIVKSAGSRWERPLTPRKRRESNTSKIPFSSQVFSKQKSKLKKKEQSSQYRSECRINPSPDHKMNQVGIKKRKNVDSSTRLHTTLPEKTPSRRSPAQTPDVSNPVSVNWVSMQNISSCISKEQSPCSSLKGRKKYEKNRADGKVLIRSFLPLELDKGLLESQCLLESERNDSSSVGLKQLETTRSAQINKRPQTLQTNNISDVTVPKRSGAKKGNSSTNKIATGVSSKPGMVNKKYTFQPTAGTLSLRDKNEVLSTWYKGARTGTKSSNTHPGNSSAITSSFLRNSQSSKSQKVSKTQQMETKEAKSSSQSLKGEFGEKTLEGNKLKKIIDQWSKKLNPNEGVSSKDMEPLILERVGVQNKICHLEKVVRDKLEQLQLIQWKKLKARDEELLLNKRLESILKKIQEIRQSDSFARVIDKQTQVFATKVPKSKS